jgi:ABC-type transporter lipoprotein component MlaA
MRPFRILEVDPHFATEAGRRFGVNTVHELADLFPLDAAATMGVIHHPEPWNDLANQLFMTE